MDMITLYTIGFTKKSAERFFSLLKNSGVRKLIDIRINNSSQLAGFAKGRDLEYFIKQLCQIDYLHIVDMAPTKDLLKDYQDKIIGWDGYQLAFNTLLEDRNVASVYPIEMFDNACFLCTEDVPDYCHRKLLVEYLRSKNKDKEIRIIHLK